MNGSHPGARQREPQPDNQKHCSDGHKPLRARFEEVPEVAQEAAAKNGQAGYFANVASFSLAWATTAKVPLSVSNTEFSPCGSQNGSPVRAVAESGLPTPARPSPPQVQKFAPCSARPALHES